MLVNQLARVAIALALVLVSSASTRAQGPSAPYLGRFAVAGEEPELPAAARSGDVRGVVIVDVRLTPEGRVASVEPRWGEPLLVEPVTKALASWQFAFPAGEGAPPPPTKGVLAFAFDPAKDAGHGVLLWGPTWRPDESPSTQEAAPPPSTEPPPGPPQAPKFVRVSGGVLAGKAIFRTEPRYPAVARAAEVEGKVVIEVRVDHAGVVDAARAVSGHPLLRDVARAAALQWLFTPTKIGGAPVQVLGTITFNFRMS